MHYIEITRKEWPDYCDSFSLQHHGWLVNLRKIKTEALEQNRDAALARAEMLATEQPLQRVSEQHDGQTVLAITVGEGDTVQTFQVAGVCRLLRERVGGAHLGLRIDNGDGNSLLIEFRSPARPEELDGMAASEL